MSTKQNSFDAIVVGSGITGGWAAKELTEKGLQTLVLERGRNVEHVKDYTTANTPPWEFEHRGKITEKDREEYNVQSTTYAFNEGTKQFFVNDRENPYTIVTGKPFAWIRGYHVGGRSITWGRQCYRLSDLDFEANIKEGIGIDWPIRYKDIEPWYSYVEKFIGVSGSKEGIPHLPDSEFLPPMEMHCIEEELKNAVEKRFSGRQVIIGRVANLTQPHNGRGKCQYRNLCFRGCPYGAYFSSNSSTLPAAAATGNLILRPNAIVHSILYDEQKDRATGVRILDADTMDVIEYKAKVIFLCASTLGTTQILLNSTTPRYREGLGNSSNVLGNYLMDHPYLAGATAEYDSFSESTYFGHRPNGIYVPRFRNVWDKHPDFLRGYGMQGSGWRDGWNRGNDEDDFGEDFKNSMTKPGPWRMWLGGWGECLPYRDNKVTLNYEKVDKWGLPTLEIDCTFRENEIAMRRDMADTAAEMLDAAKANLVEPFIEPPVPGLCIHEMGTARMGKDAKDSFLNGFNQSHEVPNLFVTDGACMTSSACQNPSLTYMALTARACDYAVRELKKRNI